MYRNKIRLIGFFILLSCIGFFSGCNSKLNISTKKAFVLEDDLIVKFLNYKTNKQYKLASKTLDELYTKSNKLEYLVEKIKVDSINLKQYDNSIIELQKYLTKYPQNISLLKTAFTISFNEEKYEKAVLYSIKILEALKEDKNESDYINVANAYILFKQYEKAIPYLETAYSFNHDEYILSKMTTIMYLYENLKENALSYLESHVRLYDFSEETAHRILLIYQESNNIEGQISVYKMLNNKYPDKKYASVLVQLYVLQNRKKELVTFLMNNKVDVAVFISLYRYINDKSDRYKIAMRLYENTNDTNFLAQAAMMEYELSIKPKSSYKTKDAIDKLTKVIKTQMSPEYLNYLGYILIEHDKDLRLGIKYIKKALTKEPESPYYLDSLAWGYYKIKKYKEAYAIMKKVVKKLGLKDKEIVFHLESIEKRLGITKNESLQNTTNK